MRLNSLRLIDFRSYENLTLAPPDGITVLTGENGAGKTNLLEAVHLCCVGRSHRTSFDKEMIRIGAQTAAVQARVQRREGASDVGVRLFMQQRRAKLLYINGKTCSRAGELMGHINCVMFSPEDLSICRGAPDTRRRFLDIQLSQRTPAYFYALQTYHSALRQRNALLKTGDASSQLAAWDEQLARAAAPVVRARREACEGLKTLAAQAYLDVSGAPDERFSLCYEGPLARSADPLNDMLRGLRDSRGEDIARQTTSFGPHRDDIRLTLSELPLKTVASQGQTRTAALALRLAEMRLMQEATSESPLLLLDDVLSELDIGRRGRLMERIGGVQTLLTCTDLSDLSGARAAVVLRVRPGRVEET